MSKKQITVREAAAMVPSGCTLALGGITLYRRPMAFVHALIHQFLESSKPDDLTLLAFTASLESDLLVGAGMIARVRTCYFGLEIFGLAPMFTHYANRGTIEIIEESEASIALGLRADLAGIGFLPGRAWLGTDLPKLRPDVRTIIDPYSGEKLIAFPAIHPNVAVLHTLQCDAEGNAILGENKGIDEELALAADTVIITTEKIVPSLDKADLVAPLVDAIVLAQNGAAPTSCHPYYPMDGKALLAYTEKVSDPKTFKLYIDEMPSR
jgi:glutaconate CoA-transferase subunit A